METISITNVREARSCGCAELVATIGTGHDSDAVWFRTRHERSGGLADPFVPAALFPAMYARCALSIDGPVSAGILSSADRVQRLKSVWDTSLSPVPIEASKTLPSSGETKAAVGAFFSGGVDSFYTLKKHRADITHLIFVHGFDIPLHRAKLREQVAGQLRQMSGALDLQLIEVETNLREYSDRYTDWEDYHGAALAAVAHFMAPCFGKIYIPSSYGYAFLIPCGSHPGLDPLWGTESLELVHDGCEATRFEKIEALAAWETCARGLRVCYEAVEGEYNCCRCKKCLWTMAFLRACGVLGEFETFRRPLDLDALRQYPPVISDQYARFASALAVVERRGDDPELADCFREGLERAREVQREERWAGKWARRLAGVRRVMRTRTCD